MKKYYSTILVAVQFFAIAVIVWLSHTPTSVVPGTVLLLSITLGLWAIVSMKIRNLKIFPEPKLDAQFTGSGPYKFIRHPMYTSVLLCTLSFVLEQPGFTIATVWAILAVSLLLKLHFEEGLLIQKFQNYTEYQSTTKKLIPYIY